MTIPALLYSSCILYVYIDLVGSCMRACMCAAHAVQGTQGRVTSRGMGAMVGRTSDLICAFAMHTGHGRFILLWLAALCCACACVGMGVALA